MNTDAAIEIILDLINNTVDLHNKIPKAASQGTLDILEYNLPFADASQDLQCPFARYPGYLGADLHSLSVLCVPRFSIWLGYPRYLEARPRPPIQQNNKIILSLLTD